MAHKYYLDLAASGLRMPIGTDLLLHEQSDPEGILHDGERLGKTVQLSAERYGTPLAVPLMDLTLEKADLLGSMGLSGNLAAFHFSGPPDAELVAKAQSLPDAPFSRRHRAQIDAVRYVAQNTDLRPIGMAIGPFSLMTKLLADPITPIALAGMGVPEDEDAGVRAAGICLALAEAAVARSVGAQIAAGAKAVLICEPAANSVFISPKQIAAGADIFERFVMQPNLRLKQRLDAAGVDLIFHDCGELTNFMVREFAARLDPAMLSLGSSRRLWEDAALVPKHVVLFGNLPTKSFYSDAVMPAGRVEEMTCELVARMQSAGHPHILGSECDVLHVPEAAGTIRDKVDVMLSCGRPEPVSRP